MESKGVQYSVALSGDRWRWMVHLNNGLQTGFAPNRALAVLAALKAIRTAAKKQRAAVRSVSEQASRAEGRPN
jgi:hypothetical protein